MTPASDDSQGTILSWDGHALAPWTGDHNHQDRRIHVADSWLVDNGTVRALAAHHRRFVESCQHEVGLPPSLTGEFLSAAKEEVPAQGRWFPRVECVSGSSGRPELLIWLRPAPAPSHDVVVTHQRGDPRRKPHVKGPDLAALRALRLAAGAIGAGEVVLLSDEGLVIEGALSAIVWWRDDVLCLPHESLTTLNSVTRGLVLELAEQRGARVRRERSDAKSLDGLEIWSLSALHGIRPVTGWRHPSYSPRPAKPSRAAAWQADLLQRGT